MFSGVRPLTDVALWARSNGLEIVLLATGAILLARLVTWLGGRITDRIDANAKETDALVRSEASKHRHALAEVITWAAVLIWVLVRPSTPTVAVAPPGDGAARKHTHAGAHHVNAEDQDRAETDPAGPAAQPGALDQDSTPERRAKGISLPVGDANAFSYQPDVPLEG